MNKYVVKYIALFVFLAALGFVLYLFRCRFPIIKILFECAKKDGEPCTFSTDCKSNLDGGNGNCCKTAGKKICTGVHDMIHDTGVYWCPDDYKNVKPIIDIVGGALLGDTAAGQEELVDATNELSSTLGESAEDNTVLCKQKFGNDAFGLAFQSVCNKCQAGRTKVPDSAYCELNDSNRVWTNDYGGIFRDGDNAYRCPKNYIRTGEAVTSARACTIKRRGCSSTRCDELGINPPKHGTTATWTGWDSHDGGTIWMCPPGHGRNSNHIQGSNACGMGNSQKSAISLRTLGGGRTNSNGSGTDYWNQYFKEHSNINNNAGSAFTPAQSLGAVRIYGTEVGTIDDENFQSSNLGVTFRTIQ